MNEALQNGKNSFSPKTQEVIQRIQALIREREAATNPEAPEAPKTPNNPPSGVVDTGLTTPPASRPSGRATGPLRLKDLIPDVAITKATPRRWKGSATGPGPSMRSWWPPGSSS